MALDGVCGLFARYLPLRECFVELARRAGPLQSMCDQRYRGALLLFLAGGAHSAWVAGAVSGRSRHGVALAERGGSGGAGRGASLCMVQTVAPGATPGAGRAAAPSTDAEGPPLPLTAGERFALDEKTMSPAALARREEQLERSYELCREITAHYSKTFFMGTRLFPPDKARAVWAVYAWCRRTDDIVDKPRADRTSLRTELTEWQRRLTDVWEGKPYDLIDLALADTVRKFPALTITPFEVRGRRRPAAAAAPPPPAPNCLSASAASSLLPR